MNADQLITQPGVAGAEQTVGGNINIDPQFVILQNSQIIAKAFAGTGGNISITAGVFLTDSASVVDASSQLWVSGTVNINSPIQSLSSTLAPLNQAYLAAVGLLRERCGVRANLQFPGEGARWLAAGSRWYPAERSGSASTCYKTSGTARNVTAVHWPLVVR